MDFLKDDLRYVNTFILTFKESDKRVTIIIMLIITPFKETQKMITSVSRMIYDYAIIWEFSQMGEPHPPFGNTSLQNIARIANAVTITLYSRVTM